MVEEFPNLVRLSGGLADQSKRLWLYAIICQAGILLISILALAPIPFTEWAALFAALMVIAYVLIKWRSDALKRMSDSAKRKSEVFDGMGWSPTGEEISDLKVSIPDAIRKKFWDPTPSKYYASAATPSPLRVMENLEESSWWSKHLSMSMARYAGVLCFSVFIIAIFTLSATLQNASGQPYEQNVARATTSIIVFLFSGGYMRLAYEYYHFGTASQNIEERARHLKRKSNASEVGALKLLHDYQIARAGAPSIPTWIWKMQNTKLKDAWDERKRLSTSQIFY